VPGILAADMNGLVLGIRTRICSWIRVADEAVDSDRMGGACNNCFWTGTMCFDSNKKRNKNKEKKKG